MKKLPITVLSGFLGAGKTTLLNHILPKKENPKEPVIANDMSNVHIETQFIENENTLSRTEETLVEMSNGCICCTFREDLMVEVEKWQSLLNIHHWTITYESIDDMQVVDALKGDTPGHEFVGIAIDFTNKTGIIYHTRPLQEDDIVHELLHIRFPDWSEQKVNYWTNLLVNRSDINVLKPNGNSSI